ncbi:amino acid ABC transporter substrate-binding protein [Anaeromicrobium sediminis]|uniref:Amino acid ABC transporter substrate-binding protein n=1 Tax=Anaeromicrobium sediminis TaxID=1478221 RepID=A0A267MNP6_9FIRM|nr:amino acid ABC transporter substrate-binding protein [Anaeromicrobium sediminis]PAB60495.1 amino acid ABC transporter substrate-binding protein [Anaeromicrobium sediminis]
MLFKNKKIIGLLSLILMIGLLAACGLKEPEVKTSASKKEGKPSIVVGTSGGYHPFTYLNNEGELDGFEIDVWKEIGKKMDIEVEFKTAEFSGLFGMLDSGKIDTIANQITITEERKNKYEFASPYVYSGAQLIVKEGNEEIKSLEDLMGKKVGVSLGSNYESLIREYDKSNEINIITYEDFIGSLQDVAIGRIDAVMNDKLAAAINIKKSGLKLQLGGDSVSTLENSFPFVNNAKNKAIIEKINKALEEMAKDNTLNEISQKWFGVDVTSK